MNRVRIFSENLRLSGLQILFGLPVLPSASALMSSPASKALVSTGIHSLLMAAPAVSFWPPRRFSAITAPALSCLGMDTRSEEHTSELQSQSNLVCRLLLEKKNQEP